MTILAARAWPSNAALIADAARLGYLDGRVLDPTYGRGRWWTQWRPETLIAHDVRLDRVDFRVLPYPDESFDSIAFDPPYKLNGTPALGDFDDAYGIQEPRTWQERHELIRDGIEECSRVLHRGGFLLLKCQDQVCSGKVRWQTRDFSDHAETCGLMLVDRFDLVGKSRPQPDGRQQVHARRNASTLLVFKKGSR